MVEVNKFKAQKEKKMNNEKKSKKSNDSFLQLEQKKELSIARLNKDLKK